MAEPVPRYGEGARGSRKSAAAYRTISEVAEELSVPQHVLRFWETKFSQIRPLKRGGGRRYYRPEDVELLKHVQGLLYGDGYTIKGVQKLLKERRGDTEEDIVQDDDVEGVPAAATNGTVPVGPVGKPGLAPELRQALEAVLDDFKAIRRQLG